MSRDMNKGDIPVLVLAVLAQAPAHGYAIARDIERQSGQRFKLREGSLYPALRVLEQDGLIKGGWEVQPSGPARKVYSLTKKGRAELAKRTQAWQRYAETVNRIIGGLGNESTA